MLCLAYMNGQIRTLLWAFGLKYNPCFQVHQHASTDNRLKDLFNYHLQSELFFVAYLRCVPSENCSNIKSHVLRASVIISAIEKAIALCNRDGHCFGYIKIYDVAYFCH